MRAAWGLHGGARTLFHGPSHSLVTWGAHAGGHGGAWAHEGPMRLRAARMQPRAARLSPPEFKNSSARQVWRQPLTLCSPWRCTRRAPGTQGRLSCRPARRRRTPPPLLLLLLPLLRPSLLARQRCCCRPLPLPPLLLIRQRCCCCRLWVEVRGRGQSQRWLAAPSGAVQTAVCRAAARRAAARSAAHRSLAAASNRDRRPAATRSRAVAPYIGPMSPRPHLSSRRHPVGRPGAPGGAGAGGFGAGAPRAGPPAPPPRAS